MFNVEFYEKEDGETPVEDFILSQDKKLSAKILNDLELLEKLGNNLRYPTSKPLRDGIFELRTDKSRILYYFMVGRKIILTNGFIKKTSKTPTREIETALRYKKDYEEREKKDQL